LNRPRDSQAGRPQLVGDLLSRFLERSGLGAKVEAASVIPEWGELVGDRIAGVTSPLRVSEGVLFVAVSTSAWLMELNLMKVDLLRRLNAGKKQGKIRQIVFVMGEGG
jgi:predicted nucleic acid-binding Zn ribbon protein